MYPKLSDVFPHPVCVRPGCAASCLSVVRCEDEGGSQHTPGPHSISSLTPPTLDTATGTKAETRDTGPGPGTAAGVRLAHWDRADTRPRPERADSGYCRAMPGPSIIQVIVGAASAWCTAHHDTGPHAPVTVSRTVNPQ